MKRNIRIFGRLWKVQTINYFTDPVNVVLGLILTTVTMICWIAFKPTSNGFSTDPFILASAIGISIIRNSQYNMNLTIGDWREKQLFSKLSYTPISKKMLAVAVLTFNWFINIFVGFILFGLAMIFKSQRTILTNVQWGPFIVGFILNVILSNFMAFFLATVFKKKDTVLVISLISYFGPMYLLGLGIPWSTVGNYEGLNIFLYVSPHRYVLSIMQAAWVGNAGDMSFPIVGDSIVSSDWPITKNDWLGKTGFGYGFLGWWLPMLITFVWIGIFGGITYAVVNHKINYGQRKYKQYDGIQKHLHYISQIKRTKNIDELNGLVDYINANNRHKLKVKKLKTGQKQDKNMQRIKEKRDKLNKEYD